MHLIAAAKKDPLRVEHHLRGACVLRARTAIDDRNLDVGRAGLGKRVLPRDGGGNGIGGRGGEADDLAAFARVASFEEDVHRRPLGVQRSADENERARLAIVVPGGSLLHSLLRETRRGHAVATCVAA